MIIYQPIDGYCYNSDTIFLYDFLTNFNIKGNVLDIGSGSGILGLLVAKDKKINLSAVEIQEFMANYTKINAKANKIEIDLKVGNFLDLEFDKKFDFLISNPPFYHENVLRSKKKELDISRFSKNLPFEEILKKANRILKPRGSFIFCYDAKQIQKIVYFLTNYKYNIEAIKFVHPKKEKEANLVMIYAKKGSKTLTKIFPPLIVFEDSKYTKEALEAFKKAGVHSIKCAI
ncbi:tRNA1(Val) (adenine(37)-N6)-methyltransferase [Nitrosophilus kaiyonis]|uniref:tRNA1(Val) (adenine(37)-N6)-methyltransferase n=1 Tax=Nitrosophilus kaiyonis TaxID=2930200 RepID=UPI0024903D76|nr:methyltransferase [Nitrosophilus kaiyonis]